MKVQDLGVATKYQSHYEKLSLHLIIIYQNIMRLYLSK